MLCPLIWAKSVSGSLFEICLPSEKVWIPFLAKTSKADGLRIGFEGKILDRLYIIDGRLAQLVRALSSHDRGRWFEPTIVHHPKYKVLSSATEESKGAVWTRGSSEFFKHMQDPNSVEIDGLHDSGDADGKKPVSSLKRFFGFVGELLHVVVISLAIILPIRYFLIQPFYVKGASMEPNFYDHEYLIIDEISYRLREPQRGDIVVFRYPDDPSQFFIKRIVALPGERIVISGGGLCILDQDHPEGFLLDESDYIGSTFTSGDKDLTLADGEYYLMGDNRAASMDSRTFGAVPRQLMIGKVMLRGWPPDRMTIFSGVTYHEDATGGETSN